MNFSQDEAIEPIASTSPTRPTFLGGRVRLLIKDGFGSGAKGLGLVFREMGLIQALLPSGSA